MATGGALLLVEDDDAIGRLVKQYLEQQDGWRVLWRRTGEEAIAELRGQPVRFVVLDIGLPGMDGFEVCRQIRAGSKVPIVMLTAPDAEPDRVAGLELGADDYVSTPFSPRELSARIKAILRRAENRTEDEVLAAREVVLRRDSHEVTVGGALVELTSKEFDLLACFLEHPGIVLSRERLLDLVWGMTYPGGTRTVDVLICVALTIGLGLVLTQREVKKSALRDLAHQVDLIVGNQGVSSVKALRPKIQAILNKSPQHEIFLYKRNDLPRWAQERLAQHQPAQGTMDFGGQPHYFAAASANPGTVILLRHQRSLLSPYVWGLLIAAAAGGLLAALAAFLLARRISRPIGRVSAAARSLPLGTHPEPVPVEGATEIATLAAAFNELAAQLRQAQEAERNFLLSVSHELKTPLTAIRGYAEAVEDGAVDPRE